MGRFLALAAALLLLPVSVHGAPSGKRVASRTVMTNKGFARAQAEILLLNILRARDRMPMYFTTMADTTGTLKRGPSLTFSGPIGNGADAAGSGALNFGLGNDTQVKSQNLFTEEFMKGLMTPVESATIAYYLEQGWPPDVLLHLLVYDLEVNGSSHRNHPRTDDAGATQRTFTKALHSILGDPHVAKLNAVDVTAPVLPAFGAAATPPLDAALLEAFLAVKAAKLSLEAGDATKGAQLQEKRKVWKLTVGGLNGTVGVQSGNSPQSPATQAAKGERTTDEKPDVARVLIRSPEAAIYYLGQVSRLTLAFGAQAAPQVRPYPELAATEPLFVLLPAGRCRELLGVTYEGKRYIVPDGDGLRVGHQCHPGQSTRALSLLTQLMQLQLSADELPRSLTINVAGD